MCSRLFLRRFYFFKNIKKYLFVLNYFISLPRKTKTNLFIMKPNISTASNILAKIREFSKGENMILHSNVVIEYRVILTLEKTVYLYEINIIKTVTESLLFNAEVVNFADGTASFSFETKGTENINDFLDIFK